jgi:HEAT repeat protein
MNKDFAQLIAALRSDEYAIWIRAWSVLSELRDRSAVEPLIEALRDEHPRVRYTAALVLASIPDPRAVEPLIALLHDNAPSFTTVGEMAAFALGAIGDQQAVEPLIGSLHNPHTRRHAIEALVTIGDPRAIEPFIHLLNTTHNPRVATILGNFGDRRAVEPLLTALQNRPSDDSHFQPGYQVFRYYAVRALGKLGDARALPLLEQILAQETEPVLKGKSVSDMAGKAIARIQTLLKS